MMKPAWRRVRTEGEVTVHDQVVIIEFATGIWQALHVRDGMVHTICDHTSATPPVPTSSRCPEFQVLRLARENLGWGYRRIHGEPATLGIEVAASTVSAILNEAGIDPAPQRSTTTWANLLRSQAQPLPAIDATIDLAASSTSTNMSPELDGRNYRQAQRHGAGGGVQVSAPCVDRRRVAEDLHRQDPQASDPGARRPRHLTSPAGSGPDAGRGRQK